VVIGHGPGTFASAAFSSPDSVTTPSRSIQGLVNGGQSRAVAGARVYVLQANTAGYGNPSVSLLTSATGNPADSLGHYALTDESGGFSIAGDYACTAGRPVYLYVRGGNSGGDGSNSAIGLMASLGACPQSGTFDTSEPFVFVNAVTTVAAAYAMAGIAADPTHVSSAGAPPAAARMANAANLASIATGFANGRRTAGPDDAVRRNKIHTLANILSACINSSSAASVGCTALFASARSGGAAGATPGDTAAAALNIARNPRANVSALYSLQPGLAAPFLPDLGSAPVDFTISLASEDLKNTIASASPQSQTK
jgi:hypothetical protein